MKNTQTFWRAIGIGAMIAVIGLGMTACDGGGGALPALTGSVSIIGTPQVGQTLTANTAYLGGNGAASFEWRVGGAAAGTSSTLTLTSAHAGQMVTVIVTRAGSSGSASGSIGPVQGGGGGDQGGGNQGNDPGGGGAGNAPGFMGETLTVSGPVWRRTWDGVRDVYTPWVGNTNVFARFYDRFFDWNGNLLGTGGSGTIINGQLNFSIGTPSNLHLDLRPLFFLEQLEFDNFQVSDAQVEFQILDLGKPCGRSLGRVAVSGNIWEAAVLYVFVDRNVTITGTGRTFVTPYGDVVTAQNLNLNLMRGWNVLHLGQALQSGVWVLTWGTGDLSHARWVVTY